MPLGNLKKKTKNTKLRCAEARGCTENTAYAIQILDTLLRGDSYPECLPKPQTGPCIQVTRRDLEQRIRPSEPHSLCHLGGHGLLMASKSQENRPPCTLWIAPLHTGSAYSDNSLGPPGEARPETPRGQPWMRKAAGSV